MSTADQVEPVLAVEQLRVCYPAKGWRAKPHTVLDGVSLRIRPGETLGLVGESGSGKTTLGRAILGLVPVSHGSVGFAGQPIAALTSRHRRRLARDLQVVFQDPYTSLNPWRTIGDTLIEPLLAQGVPARQARAQIAELLDRVALPAGAAERYPREFSGGQRQRIAIARALAIRPRLVICDEPVSALDLLTQRRVLDLLIHLQEQTGVAYLFISHDLAVIRAISHRVVVLRAGEIVEQGPVDQVTTAPQHPYTRRLLLAAPVADPVAQQRRRAQWHATAERAQR